MDQDQIVKIICYGIGCVIAYYLLMALAPYLVLGFALYAFGYLIMQTRNDRSKRH
jgi:uncharacterized BrkB/YihY/UPF0761 family membrane protein